MGQIDLSHYKNIYLQTAREYVNSMFLSCDKLTNNVSDREAINKVHISSHSLKSQSQVMGFTNIAAISTNIEKTSNDILNGVSQIDNAFLVLLKNSVDELNLELAQIEKGNAETV